MRGPVLLSQMTNGSAVLHVWSGLGGGYKLDAQALRDYFTDPRTIPDVTMWDVLSGQEFNLGFGVALILLGVWYLLRRPAARIGWAWWVVALSVAGYTNSEAANQIYRVRVFNAGTVGTGTFTAEAGDSTSGSPVAYFSGPSVALSPGAASGFGNVNIVPPGTSVFARQKDSSGTWGASYTLGAVGSGTTDFTIYWTGGGTNLASSGTSTAQQQGKLHVILQNNTSSNQNYQIFLDGVPQGTPVAVGPGAYFDVNYNGRMGNFEIRDEFGRVVWGAAGASPFWTPNDDRMLVVPIWRPSDDGAPNVQNNAPPPNTNAFPNVGTNAVQARDVQQAANIAHNDALNIINLLGNLSTNRGIQTNLNISDGSLSNTIPANMYGQGLREHSNVLWQANSYSNAAWSRGYSMVNVATGWFGSIINWTNIPTTTVTALTVNVAGFTWDLHPLHDSRWASLWGAMYTVFNWVVAIIFLGKCWKEFWDTMKAFAQTQQVEGSKQSVLGTNASLLTSTVFWLIFAAMFTSLAATITMIGPIVEGVLSYGLSPAVIGTPLLLQAWSLMNELFPVQFVLVCVASFWVFRFVLFGTWGIYTMIHKAQLV